MVHQALTPGCSGVGGAKGQKGVPGIVGPKGDNSSIGAVYVRWGRTTCPSIHLTPCHIPSYTYYGYQRVR